MNHLSMPLHITLFVEKVVVWSGEWQWPLLKVSFFNVVKSLPNYPCLYKTFSLSSMESFMGFM